MTDDLPVGVPPFRPARQACGPEHWDILFPSCGCARCVEAGEMTHRGGQLKWGPARELCARCPARRDCLDHAIRYAEPAGMWGGHTPKERQRIALGLPPEPPRGQPKAKNDGQPRPLTGPDDPRHGHLSTYNYHRCRCDLCKNAKKIASRIHRAIA